MLIEQTLDKLNAMKLGGMDDALQRQLQTDQAAAPSFEERIPLLVETEWTTREQPAARTAFPRRRAALSDDAQGRGLRLLNGHQLLTLAGLRLDFLERACHRGRYVRMPRLLHDLAVGRGHGALHPAPSPASPSSTCSPSTPGY